LSKTLTAALKGFEFDKALMQEHFNENYIESDKFPKAIFKGKIDDAGKINFTKDGNYNATVTGLLTMHGETKNVSAPASFTVQNGKLTSSSTITIALSDFKISIPVVVKDNISNTVKIMVICHYENMN